MGLFDSIANIATGGAYGVTKAVVTSKPVKAVTRSVTNFVKDTAKVTVAGLVMPVNSITGHRYNPKLETNIGKVVGGSAIAGAANINILAKSFADSLTGGYASKAVNLIRAKKNQEWIGHYGEIGLGGGNGNQFIDKVIAVENSASLTLGKLYGSKYGLGASPQTAKPNTQELGVQALASTYSDFLHAPTIVLGSRVIKITSTNTDNGNPGTLPVGEPLPKLN